MRKASWRLGTGGASVSASWSATNCHRIRAKLGVFGSSYVMAVALVGGAAIGALFGVLYDVVKESMGRTVMQYKPLIEDLKFTLDCLRPRIIQEIGDHNVALGLPNDDIERLQQQMEEGIKLVGRLSKLSMWNCYVLCSCCKCSKPSYTDRLIQLDRSLRALLEVLRLQEARDMKENLLLNRKIYEKQDELATRQSEILKIAGEILRAQQEDKGVQELSGSSAQTVVQEQIGGSGVQQAASINRGGAALGAVFEVLFSAVQQTKEKTRMFKRILGHLESTLDSIKPLMEEIAEYNKVLHLTAEELESFRVEMEKGVELVRKCSKVSLWASNKKYEYTSKLLGLDESLQRLINILRVQLARDATESLVSVTNVETVTMKIEESGIIQHDQTESRRPLVELPSGDGGESSGSGAETTPHEQNGESSGQQMAPSGGGVGAAALGAVLARDMKESLVSVSNIEVVINQIEGSGVVKLQNEQNEAKGSCEVPAAMAKSVVGLNARSVEGTRDVTETLDPEANIKVGCQKVEENWVAQSKTEHPSDTVGLDAMNVQLGARSMEETSVTDVEAGLKRIQGKEVSELDVPFRELKEDVVKDEEDEELDEQVEDHHDRKKKGAESVTSASGDEMAICKADGCAVDLSDAKTYNRKHRVCELHSKAPLVNVSGLKRRFCHQCSKFHDLSKFDDTKQSCHRHLPYIERDGTGTQLKYVSDDTDTVISQIERSGVVQSQNDQSEIKGSYEVVEATPPAVGLNVLSVQGTRDSKETLQTSVSNTELRLKQIQGKAVFDSEPLYAKYKETKYIPLPVTVDLDVLLRGLKRFLLNDEVSTVVLTGPQGSGKTTLAKYFCEDEEVKNIFKNNIFFVVVSKNPSLSLMVQTLYQQKLKGFQIPALQDESIAFEWLRQFFMATALHPSVLVLDDVWPGSESILDKFDEFKTPNYKIMVTSRSEFPAFGFPYYLKSLNDEDEITLSRQSHTEIESLDYEFLSFFSSTPSVTFDDKSLIDHFPNSSASELGNRSSHVSIASTPIYQFRDSSASTLGDKSHFQEDAGTMFPLDNPVKSTRTYMQQKLVFKVCFNEYEKKKALEALKAVSTFDGVYSIGWDSQNQRLTVVGQELDPMPIVRSLRKITSKAEIISVGPAKEEIKKDRKQTIHKDKQQSRITQLNKKIASNAEIISVGSASNTELRLKQIQGKAMFDSEPLYAKYKETEYIPLPVTVDLDVLLRGLKRFLLNDEVSTVVLTGPQGSGKTTLAKYFCEDEEVKNIFKNNIFFVVVSKNPSLSLMVQTLYQQIELKGFQIPALQDESIAFEWLRQFFMATALHPSVLVLDDVWPGPESILDKFDEFKTPNYKIMVTSRSEFPAFGFPYHLKSLNDEDEMTLSRQSHTEIESLDYEFLSFFSSTPSVTFDDKSLIDHFPNSSASDLGNRSSHVSIASTPIDQFRDSSASTLGDKSHVQEDAGTMFPLDNPVKSTRTYMQQKLVFKVCFNEYEKKKALEALKAVSAFDGVYSIGWDSQNQRLTVVGQELDPVPIVKSLRKITSKAEIISVGPAKEEIKKDRKQTIHKDKQQSRITQLNKKIASNAEIISVGSASNTELRLKQIQGKAVFDSEPPKFLHG